MQYVVRTNDSLAIIAQRFGTTEAEIRQINNLTDVDQVSPGQVLTIPVGGTQTCPRLQRGSRGESVRTLQRLLRNEGFNPGAIDGWFGENTERAVRRFQVRSRIPETGIVDVRTWEALGMVCTPITPPQEFFCPVLRRGERGSAVRFLQESLRKRRVYGGPLNGIFDARTEQAVRQFQQREGLAVTGIVRGLTWRALGVTCVPTPPAPPSGSPQSTRVGRGIRHTLHTNKSVYRRGEIVRITLSKTNITDHEITLRYRTRQIVEITVRNLAGGLVWSFGSGRTFAPSTRVITIFPGGTQVIKEDWRQVDKRGRQVPPGTYVITAVNLGTNVSVSVRIQIR